MAYRIIRSIAHKKDSAEWVHTSKTYKEALLYIRERVNDRLDEIHRCVGEKEIERVCAPILNNWQRFEKLWQKSQSSPAFITMALGNELWSIWPEQVRK